MVTMATDVIRSTSHVLEISLGVIFGLIAVCIAKVIALTIAIIRRRKKAARERTLRWVFQLIVLQDEYASHSTHTYSYLNEQYGSELSSNHYSKLCSLCTPSLKEFQKRGHHPNVKDTLLSSKCSLCIYFCLWMNLRLHYCFLQLGIHLLPFKAHTRPTFLDISLCHPPNWPLELASDKVSTQTSCPPVNFTSTLSRILHSGASYYWI